MAENDNANDAEDQEENSEVTGQGENVTAENEDTLEAAIEAALAARIDAIRETERQEARRELEDIRQQERHRESERVAAEELINSFGSTVREVRDNLKRVKLTNDDGQEITLTDGDIEALVVNPLQRYNQTGERVATTKTLLQLAEAALNTLPEQSREGFIKRAANRPLNDWLTEYAESKAEQTSWAKQSKANQEAAIKAAEARGFKRGQATGTNPPPQGEGTPKQSGGAVDRNSISGAAKALSQGLISEQDYRDIYKKLTG